MYWRDESVADLPELSFEDAFQRLEDAVAMLEAGELTIDQMIEKFEEGMALVGLCRRRLDHAHARVSILAREAGENGLDQELNGDLDVIESP
jgi:exodeoxyribonuclease VII small subunit